jgi:hypothetical protein
MKRSAAAMEGTKEKYQGAYLPSSPRLQQCDDIGTRRLINGEERMPDPTLLDAPIRQLWDVMAPFAEPKLTSGETRKEVGNELLPGRHSGASER